MKKLLLITLIILLIISCASCSDTKKDEVNEKNETDQKILNAQESEPLEEKENTEEPIGGGDTICPVHTLYYHAYPDIIVEYIGRDNFYSWIEGKEVQDDEGCYPEANIFKLIEYFDVPNDIIIETYKNDFYNCEWDMESLLSRDEEGFDESSRRMKGDDSHNEYRVKLLNERALKHALFDIMERKEDSKTAEYYNLISDNGSVSPVTEVSIYEMVSNTSLTKEDFIDALDGVAGEESSETSESHFDYDLDLLFGEGNALVNSINTIEDNGYESKVKLADALLHKGETNNDHVVY